MMSKAMRQSDRVLRYLIDTNHITRLDAAREIGCFELASRIGELEARGVHFKREKVHSRNRYGDRTRFIRYHLAYVPLNVLLDLDSREHVSSQERGTT